MKKIIALLMAGMICMFSLTGCFSSDESDDETKAPTAEKVELTNKENDEENLDEEETVEVKEVSETAEIVEEDLEEGVDNTVQAVITMESGDVMTLELYPDVAPITVENFKTLASEGFYDGLTFHRIISGFMIQGGDPRGNGTGGPGYSIKGEFAANGVENNLKHTRGVISMARSQHPDSAGSQFFIMHEDAPHLDGQYAAFGKVIEGIEVVDAIASVDTDYYDAPLDPVVIESIKIVD